MAGASLLTLLDDITAVLDDVALMTKIAAKKTSGVLGDDLALNAQQVSGVKADRELPVVWAVAKGSLINKLILVPLALAISAFIPWAITPLLMLGGAFLCYEGVEKITHYVQHKTRPTTEKPADTAEPLSPDALAQREKNKVNGAIRTDFILSAEIITITLGTVADAGFLQQLLVLAGIAVLMTLGVYGLVACIVRLDDIGLYLRRKTNQLLRTLGNGLVNTTPYLMRTLSVVGTAAMFMVGGGILTHGIATVHQAITQWAQATAIVPAIGHIMPSLTSTALNMLFGVAIGGIVLIAHSAIVWLRRKNSGHHQAD